MTLAAVADALIETTVSPGRPYVAFSARSGAWILVPDKGRIRSAGLALYHPQSIKGFVAKNLIASGVWRPQIRHVKEDTLDELSAMLGRTLGLRDIHCAFYFRAPGPFAKTIILVMDGAGRAIAYVKLAATAPGASAIAHEAAVLERLAPIAGLSAVVPRVIAQAAWRDFPLLVLSAGPLRRPPRSFGPAHRDFLRHVRDATVRTMNFADSAMMKNMIARFERRREQLGAAWRSRYDWAFGEIGRRAGRLALGLAHRDFVPWNMRRSDDGSLYVFDWELAADECIPGWDIFHYHMARHAFAGETPRATSPRQLMDMMPANERDGAALLLLCYLADVALFSQDRLIEARMSPENKFIEAIGAMLDALRGGG